MYLTDPAEVSATLCSLTGPVAIDTETIGCDPRRQSPVGNAIPVLISFAWEGGCAVVEELDERLKAWCEDESKHKVGTNVFGYDFHVLANVGIKLRGIVADTLRMSRLLNPAQTWGHGLKDWGERLGFNVVEFKEASAVVPHAKIPKVYKTTRTVRRNGVPTVYTRGAETYEIHWGRRVCLPLDEIKRDYPAQWQKVKQYAAQDAVMSLAVYKHLKKELEAVKW